jgi:hypothetical protein
MNFSMIGIIYQKEKRISKSNEPKAPINGIYLQASKNPWKSIGAAKL